MSDQMAPTGVTGFMGAASDPVRKNTSVFNPLDLAAMKQSGQFEGAEDMKVVDFLPMIGIDPQGPMSQLTEFMQKQVENADMVGKMQNIAADSTAMEGEPPAPTEGLESLLQTRS